MALARSAERSHLALARKNELRATSIQRVTRCFFQQSGQRHLMTLCPFSSMLRESLHP
jgi:hypothetical protein